MRAIKELHLVLGLGKLSPEDTVKLFAEAVTDLAAERRKHAGVAFAETGVISATPPGLLADAEFEVVKTSRWPSREQIREERNLTGHQHQEPGAREHPRQRDGDEEDD
jgi:hypothetical protein